jgi:hypothetical protein
VARDTFLNHDFALAFNNVCHNLLRASSDILNTHLSRVYRIPHYMLLDAAPLSFIITFPTVASKNCRMPRLCRRGGHCFIHCFSCCDFEN